MTTDRCECCQQVLRAQCPACGRQVEVRKGALAAHETATVHGGHVQWGGCPGSGSKHIRVTRA